MYEMVKKIIGRSCGSSGSPALLPAGLSPHCCALLSSSCCPGPLQGMGTEFGALPLRWHLPRPGQPHPSSEQVSWLWALRRAGSSRMGFSTAPKCIHGAALQEEAAAFGLGRLGHSSGWACTWCRSVGQPWGWHLVQCQGCVVTGAVPGVCCPCSVQQYLGLLCLDTEHQVSSASSAGWLVLSPFPATLPGSAGSAELFRTIPLS